MQMKWAACAAAVVALLAVTTGCGGGTTQPANGTAPTASSGQKTLIFGRGGDSVTLDPSGSTDDESNMVCEEIYDTLVTYKIGTPELQPDLATSWEPSKDGMSWTFHLQQGVKFSDGTPFNADAVVFNFQRWGDPNSPYHKGSSFAHYKSDLGGFYGSPGAIIKDVEKVDDYTVRIDLTHPFAPLPNILTQVAYSIASPEAIKKYNGDISHHPVGTGAFEFVSWTPNDKIVLKKNPNYRTPGLPKLDQLIFQVIPDNTARLNALRAGQIDLMEGLNPSDIQSVKSDPNLNLYVSPSNNVGYLAFNTQKKPFDDPRVRQAIAMCIDKKALIDAYYNGLADAGVTILPPKNWAYDSSIQDYPVDIAKAKQLLAEAGYPNGFDTELWAMPIPRPYMPQPQQIATAIQGDLAKIGIHAKIVTYDWATYLKKTDSGEHTMCLLGWSAGTWDPTTFMYTLLDSKNAVPPANNSAFYKNPAVDKLLEQALTVSDQNQRAELYKQAQKLVFQDEPYVPLVHSQPVRAGSKRVIGFTPQVTGGPQFTSVDLSN
ncbi:ABC transporter substrate-binding protein [Alicyclobacillus macrosporangiidus]|jgi:peptide/nickel transport system substrate-binding protein|uniref:Peptide/nickel transport system substrate-binding protein n=1 Tax=Alicyclobacillus macrosporangiidus TaxID=392015 RepID=A0A1I7J1Q5_9BACL|nr:ABC transporter substrate-binding protein [Alicyclobacillus macrosporangiidus]SFU79156.1 peptide/nickel transport system substrate-binding protein [Alicyclobacillus macrosporangiidus]